MTSQLVESIMPFKVRARCGHVEVRPMRETTAGVPYTSDTILGAPDGRPCQECERVTSDMTADFTSGLNEVRS